MSEEKVEKEKLARDLAGLQARFLVEWGVAGEGDPLLRDLVEIWNTVGLTVALLYRDALPHFGASTLQRIFEYALGPVFLDALKAYIGREPLKALYRASQGVA
jgi:hypothetical protein